MICLLITIRNYINTGGGVIFIIVTRFGKLSPSPKLWSWFEPPSPRDGVFQNGTPVPCKTLSTPWKNVSDVKSFLGTALNMIWAFPYNPCKFRINRGINHAMFNLFALQVIWSLINGSFCSFKVKWVCMIGISLNTECFCWFLCIYFLEPL